MEATTFDGHFVERKVPLPQRWLRGFAEAQVLGAGLALRAEVPPAQAAAVLRSLPRLTLGSGARTTRWVVPTGRPLPPMSRPAPGAICLPGAERLTGLIPVLRHATGVRLYAPENFEGEDKAVVWEVGLPGMRLTLLLSPSASRGFSGEGDRPPGYRARLLPGHPTLGRRASVRPPALVPPPADPLGGTR